MNSDDFDGLSPVEGRVFKSGNSLAIRIPSAVAKSIACEDGDAVEMAVDDGMLYVRKAPSRELAELVALITPENRHDAIFDSPAGVEVW